MPLEFSGPEDEVLEALSDDDTDEAVLVEEDVEEEEAL